MPRGPQSIGNVLAELMARRGFARLRSASALQAAWRDAAGELVGGHSRVVGVRRGKLEVIVSHSALVQELTFRKAALLAALAQALPDESIKDLRFRVGALDG
jgi:predicted nucleic acid-binding Zn ribbon protein